MPRKQTARNRTGVSAIVASLENGRGMRRTEKKAAKRGVTATDRRIDDPE